MAKKEHGEPAETPQEVKQEKETAKSGAPAKTGASGGKTGGFSGSGGNGNNGNGTGGRSFGGGFNKAVKPVPITRKWCMDGILKEDAMAMGRLQARWEKW